jgi:hypothetical protein
LLKKSIKTITYTVILLLAAPLAAQQAAVPSGKPGAAAPKKQMHKAQPRGPQQKRQGGPRRGRLEKLACKLGNEDRQARIAVELIGGRVESLAYYSKWKPRTCSVHIVRDDAYSKWEDTGHVTVVTLNEEKGSFLIDHDRRSVKFLFRDIDRERFCGMPGKITGSLTVTRGRDQCELEGVMDYAEEPPAPPPPATPAELQGTPLS